MCVNRALYREYRAVYIHICMDMHLCVCPVCASATRRRKQTQTYVNRALYREYRAIHKCA